jgi:protein-L-isoaspartate(D-aspartate) O-methyltransferase
MASDTVPPSGTAARDGNAASGSTEDEALVSRRDSMVDLQLRARGITDARVLAAMRRVPRHAFVPVTLQDLAYEDTALPIDCGQTISQPFIVGAMLEAAHIGPEDRVLEIGAGSGYAAAVLGELAGHVDTIERHAGLAASARRVLAALGYGERITVHEGDGSLGLPAHAPFDAIIAAAGGPSVPQVLCDQLRDGGRLVMPVGDSPVRQQLVLVTRGAQGAFERRTLGAVTFVPMVGEHAWSADDEDSPREVAPESASASPATDVDLLRNAAVPLRALGDKDFARPFAALAACRVVLLGEASHGSKEFYQARAAITRMLVEEHGFNIVAVEADWPDAASVDRYIRHRAAPARTEPPFRRFPAWMWRNEEMETFIEWLRAHNEGLPDARRAAFYGLDLYSLSASIDAVLAYLDKVDPEAASLARERYGCLEQWQHDPALYGRLSRHSGYARCERAVITQLTELLAARTRYAAHDGAQFLDAAQNARLVAAAERYYRSMYYGAAESWNLRDTHMFETLRNLLDAGGQDARAVVWAHNSHIGDASATAMGQQHGELNLGQLCRDHFGDRAGLVGFGTYDGTVAAASQWDGPMEVKAVKPALADSVESLAHDTGLARFLVKLRTESAEPLREALLRPRLQRFIGVIYRPETERQSHYAETELARQYDFYTWFDRTSAVTPLVTRVRPGVPETYPFGV